MRVPTYNSIEERRSLCLVANRTQCNVPPDKCEQCKAFGYVPLGLSSMLAGGFSEIKKRQRNG